MSHIEKFLYISSSAIFTHSLSEMHIQKLSNFRSCTQIYAYITVKIASINSRSLKTCQILNAEMFYDLNHEIFFPSIFLFSHFLIFTFITRLPLVNGSIVFNQNFRCQAFTGLTYFDVPWVQKSCFLKQVCAYVCVCVTARWIFSAL